MRLALIPPVDLLWTTSITNYQLMLPRQAMDYPKYRKHYNRMTHITKPTAEGRDFVILDNGIAEGDPISPHMLAYSARMWNVQEVVMPDIIGDAKGTMEATKKFWIREHQLLDAQPHKPKIRTMFVVQGKTFTEVLECARWAIDREWIDTIGIPRHLVSTLDSTMARTKVANEIQKLDMRVDQKIHFLGASALHPGEAATLGSDYYTNQEHVRGMDTSMPFNYAYRNSPMIHTLQINRPDNYFDLKSEHFPKEILLLNIADMLNACGTKGPGK